MTPEHVPGADITKSTQERRQGVPVDGGAVGTLSDLPPSFPSWARKLAELYFSGTTSAFVLHGNTYDYVRSPGREEEEYVGLAEFLAEQLFGRWSLVLHYDLGRGLRVAAGRERTAAEGDGHAGQPQGRRSQHALEGTLGGDRPPRSIRQEQPHGRGRRPSQRGGHRRSGVVRVSLRRPRPLESAGIVAAGDAAQLGNQSAREAAQHGVRAGG